VGAPAAIRRFRSPPWVKVVASTCALLFITGGFVSYYTRGWSWVTIVFVGLALFGVAGAFDAFTQRIELHDERIVIVRNLRRREYPRDLFVKAQWGKGVPVALQTVSGAWVQLPGVGASNQGLVNTLRAWIKSSPAGGQTS
jgi:hypothetical protein